MRADAGAPIEAARQSATSKSQAAHLLRNERPLFKQRSCCAHPPSEDYRILLALLCGFSTLIGFLLPAPTRAFAPLFFIGAYVSGGWFASLQLAGELRRGVFDINLLMILVALGAAGVGAWAEGGTLLFLFSLSNALERFANHRTEQTISSLLKSAPETVDRRENGVWVEVPADSLGVGDELLVKPGELFPVDRGSLRRRNLSG